MTKTKSRTLGKVKDKKSESEHYAKSTMSSATMSAVVTDGFTKQIFPNMEISDVASELREKIISVQNGDMQSIEAMLIGQAQALQTLFVCLGRMAASKTQLNQYVAFMNLSLKAQSQSRATIQALTELKYPKQATFVKQANIANGHQQVNYATNTRVPAHAKENGNISNELLEANDGNEGMDNRAAQTTGKADKAMATMAT